MFTILMSAKLATPNLKIKIFWNKGCDVIIPHYNITNKTLLCDSNNIVDVVMWIKSANSSMSMREVIIMSKKKAFFLGGVVLVQVQ